MKDTLKQISNLVERLEHWLDALVQELSLQNLFIQRASYTKYILRGNMGIDHGGLESLMAGQFLNRPNLRAIMSIIESIFNNKSTIIR
jgi:hypothetical protein